tara:strand:+ start:548 stop:979 length:432 start_codon:yes stop_codon:yes gene_type:complete
VKKKSFSTSKDKKDWLDFTKQMGNIQPKPSDILSENNETKKEPKLDLHGASLSKSNEMVRNFINKSFNYGYKKLIIVTGKGTRSKAFENPYVSEKLSVLRYSIPEFIKQDEDLNRKVIRISVAEIKDGGEGAIYIFLKNNKNL